MTNKEYITISLKKFNVSADSIELIIYENDIPADDEVTIVDCKKAIHNSLTVWIPVHSNMSEGGVSESWDMGAIKLYYSALSKELGVDDIISKGGSIRDKSNIW